MSKLFSSRGSHTAVRAGLGLLVIMTMLVSMFGTAFAAPATAPVAAPAADQQASPARTVSNPPDNERSPWVNDTVHYDNLSGTIVDNVFSIVPPCVGGVTNIGNLTDTNLTNNSTVSITGIGCNATLSVKDGDAAETIPGGSFAGFKVSSADLLSGSIASTIRVETWNNNVFQEGQDVVTNLIGINPSLIDGSGNTVVGFITNSAKPFDEIRIKYQTLVGILFTAQVYHAVVQEFVPGPALTCNEQTIMNAGTGNYPVIIDSGNTGITGLACVGCSLNNTENVISTATSDYATLTLAASLGTTGSVAVQDVLTDYPAGTFAGFNIENPNLISGNLLSGMTVKTYKNGVFREQSNAGTLVSLSSSLLNGTGAQTVGFVTTMDFDEVKLEVTNLLGLLNVTRIYNAVFQRFCAGPDMSCTSSNKNTPMSWVEGPTNFPVIIDGANTGINGAACVGCSVNDSYNVINGSASDYATIVLLASLASTGSIAVKDQITTYPAGYFIGFDIENTTLLDISLLNGITITTYNNGVPQETKTGTGQLLSANTSLITGDGRRVAGFITSLPFDEAKLTINPGLLGIALGSTKVYRAVIESFCAVDLTCNQTYWLSNPQFPVVVDSALTGITGVACVGCSINNQPALISPSQTDYTTVTVVAGVLSEGSVAVVDGIDTFPAGSTAGFAIQDVNNLLQLDLFNALTVCTYNNGVQQECKTGGQLIDLAVLINWIGTGAGIYNIGFQTTQPFDEVQLKVGSLASVINIIRVYSGYVDTRGATGEFCATDVSISKTASTNQIIRGVPFFYTVTVGNSGPTSATNVTITDPIPASLNINGTPTLTCSVPGHSGTVAVSGNNITGTVATMAVNETCTLTINVTLP